MKISTKIRYGIRALSYIAESSENDEKRYVRIKEISEKTGITIQYLEQILFKLKNAEIILGKRGPTGGYQLNKTPEDIDLLTLFRVLDQEVSLISCDKGGDMCIGYDCKTRYIWEKLDSALSEILKKTTLREIMQNGEK